MLPVVFLPGVMGSRLFWKDFSSRTWDPDSLREMKTWILEGARGGMRLADAMNYIVNVRVIKQRGDVRGDRIERGWGGVSKNYYYPLLEQVEAEGYEAYALGYDWRQNMLTQVDFVLDRLEEFGVERFDLVTHSMGGLLARAVLQQTPQFAERVRAAVHLCQPCLGAVVLYRRIFTGCQTGLDGDGLVDKFFCTILGRDGRQFITNVCGLPGAMQLLPSAEYRSDDDRPLRGYAGEPADFVREIYGNAEQPPGLTPPNPTPYVRLQLQETIAWVEEFQQAVRDSFFPNAWYVVGDSLETDVAISEDNSPVRRAAGDGTVPATSAAALRAQQATLSEMAANPGTIRVAQHPGLEHSTAAADPDVIKTVIAILNFANG